MMKKQTKGHHEETNRQTEAEHSVEKLALSLTQKKKKEGAGYVRSSDQI